MPRLARAAPFVPARDPQCIAVSPDGEFVVTACSGLSDESFPPRPHPEVRKCGIVAMWEVATGKRVWRAESFGDFTNVKFSPDGKIVATSRLFATRDGLALHEVHLRDAKTGKTIRVLDRCHAFDFSPDGGSLTVLSRTRCVTYALNDWTKERQTKSLGGAIQVGYSPDGKSLCGIVSQEGKFAIRVCDSVKGEQTHESRLLDAPFYSFAFHPTGNLLVSGHDRGLLIVWTFPEFEFKGRLATGVPGLARPFFSPDGKFLAGGCQENADVVVWDAESFQELHRHAGEKGSFHTHLQRAADETIRPEKDPTRFCFGPTNAFFALGHRGGTLRATESGQELKKFGD